MTKKQNRELKDAMSAKAGVSMEDNGGRRSGIERRQFSFNAHIPERRHGENRRSGKDRRSGMQWRKGKERRAVFE
jgi:hypothetical protein